MSWKSMPMSPPHLGIVFCSKIANDRRRKSRIHAGSFFISEICATIVLFSPFAARNTSCDGVMKSYLLISPRAESWSKSDAMVGLLFLRQDYRISRIDRIQNERKGLSSYHPVDPCDPVI